MFGVLCSGQGGQSPSMFDVLAGEPASTTVLNACEAELGIDLRALARGAGRFDNRAAQPLICAFQAAAWAGLRERLPAPRAIAGYSIGELGAYACADALGPRGVVALARLRAEAMDAACPRPSGLLAVRGLPRAELEALGSTGGFEIAIVNEFDRIVAGGEAASLQELAADAARLGALTTRLPVSIAAHTSLMAPARPAFEQALSDAGLRAPRIPVVAGVDGFPVFDRQRAAQTLSRQISETIEWTACMDAMVEMGCKALLELGPGSFLAEMFRERRPEPPARSISEFRTLAGVASWTMRACT
jgi:[acyl-carrier-protein] S-malonyltransferase